MTDWRTDLVTRGWHLHEGEALAFLRELPAGSIDALVCDPPYMIGAVSVGDPSLKCGGWTDMMNSAEWFAMWMREGSRVLRHDGFLAAFGNWRSLPVLIRALDIAGRQATSCVVWDKEWIATAGPRGFRSSYEVMVVSANDNARIDDRSERDVWAHKWMAGNHGTTGHPAEKPVDLMRRAVRHFCRPGGTVLDPFAGSGTTGVAALREGRRFIGCEAVPHYADIARRRIGAEVMGTDWRQPEALPLFGAAK